MDMSLTRPRHVLHAFQTCLTRVPDACEHYHGADLYHMLYSSSTYMDHEGFEFVFLETNAQNVTGFTETDPNCTLEVTR